MTVRWIGGVSFQIKCDANIVCIVITMKTINYFNNNYEEYYHSCGNSHSIWV
jgi:hypothetical protein